MAKTIAEQAGGKIDESFGTKLGDDVKKLWNNTRNWVGGATKIIKGAVGK
jgi:hypothetical protein